MSRSPAAGDAVVAHDDDDDDTSLVFIDHVSPPTSSSPTARACSRLPATSSSPGPAADSDVVGRKSSRNNSRRKSPSPTPRLPAANTPLLAAASTPRPPVPLTASRRKSVAAPQPVSPEPDLQRRSLRRPTDGTTPGVGYRLGRRKVLAERRKRLADYSLLFAMFGIVSMMVEMELTMAELYDKVRFLRVFHIPCV